MRSAGRQVRVAAAQTAPVAGDVEANIAAHLRLAVAAAAAGADVVVFPELSLIGYELERASELAFSLDDPRLLQLRSAASEHDLTLVVGAPLRLEKRLHIAAIMLAPEGSAHVYTKRHLGAFAADDNPGGAVPPPEPTVFQPGDRDPVVNLCGLPAALAICADTGRATHPQRAAERGACLYLASMFVIPAALEAERAMLAGYARRHRMAVVMANFCGVSGGLPSGGCSSIWSADGELQAELGPTGEGVTVASVPLAGAGI